MNAPLVVIVGPTASGKSALAMEIAKTHSGEIICADSRTIYKGMDIGTAKPTKQDQQQVPHHLLDIIEPDRQFTVADFKRQAVAAINDIWQRGKMPIMVGGSGLYVDSVIFDYQFGKIADPAVRAQLNELSVQELNEICRQKGIDLPENHLNKRYLIRSIELGGLIQQPKQLRANTLVVGLTIEKEKLLQKIKERAHIMIKQGIVREVTELAKTYGWGGEAMRGNIYRVLRHVVEGNITLEQGVQDFIKSDVRLAKKQLTWFKRNPHIVWGKPSQLRHSIAQFINNCSR